MSEPAADIEIDGALVQALLTEQCPDLADLPVERAASGWDNEMFRLGERLCVRLPRRTVAALLTLNEQQWLPVLSKMLPLAVPEPLRFGRPGSGYPWNWSVVPWFEGTPCDISEFDARDASALMEFLRALHRPAPVDAPRNPFRGCALADRIDALQPRLARVRLQTTLFSDPVRMAWERALAAPIDIEATWIHGDLHPKNILVKGGRLSAVIDWGDMAAGDRATDLACLWMLIAESKRRLQAMRAYGSVSPQTWTRARGWAVAFGLLFTDTGLGGDSRFMTIGERTLRRVAEDPPILQV